VQKMLLLGARRYNVTSLAYPSHGGVAMIVTLQT
jgi:hypothetical protein